MDRGERFNIGKGCFLGAAVCILMALWLLPMAWWAIVLASIAGFCSGYLGYRVGDVRQGVWGTLKNAGQDSRRWAKAEGTKIAQWCRKHKNWFLFVALVVPIITLIAIYPQQAQLVLLGWALAISTVLAFSWLVLSVFYIFGISVVACGCEEYKQCCSTFSDKEEMEQFKAMGYREAEFNFRNAIKWFSIMVYLLARDCCLTLVSIPVVVVKSLKNVFCGIGLLVKYYSLEFLEYIHCHQRIFCGMTGMLAGLVTIYFVWPLQLTILQVIMLAVFGGIIGAVAGVLLCELAERFAVKNSVENCL